MRILVLCKRRPQGRDLFIQPYGRFVHLCRGLAHRGHDLELALLSYERSRRSAKTVAGLRFLSFPALPDLGLRYLRTMLHRVEAWQPDWIFGFSDIWYGVLAVWLARQIGASSLIDAYDNFETYHPMAPPLPQLWRGSLRAATLVTAAGPQLAELMSRSAGGRDVEVVPMAADPEFFPRDRLACRRQLGLPSHVPLIGYTGAIDPTRGIAQLFQIASALRAEHPNLLLVMSGRRARGVKIPPEVLWLGYRPPTEVPLLINSLDLALILNRPSAFGHYSYPAKLYEAMACQIPVVAAKVAGTSWILRDHPGVLAEPGSISDFVAKAKIMLAMGRYDFGEQQGWSSGSNRLATLIGG